MNRDAALQILSQGRGELARDFRVVSLGVFGSVARNEAGPGSDVDVLVELAPQAHLGLFGFVRLKRRLEDLLGCRVDLVTPDALRPQLRQRILGELVLAA
ncbi:MAG TPA: nucleotidyltransferase family protein [Thermoanaerobaculia bacterium]|nr:nucleotidyltransferase family protein [Thermoanaerobaculia bacterium]